MDAPRWLRLAPLAVITAAGLALSPAQERPASARADLSVPVPRPVEPLVPIPDEEALGRALELVAAYRPAGSQEDVSRILAPELAQAVPEADWVFYRPDGRRVQVTFRPYGRALEDGQTYEFEVDLISEAVTATAETEAALRPVLLSSR